MADLDTFEYVQLFDDETGEIKLYPRTMAKVVLNKDGLSLENVEPNAEENDINTISVNGRNVSIVNKNVNIEVPNTPGLGININNGVISADTTFLATKPELNNKADKSDTYTKEEVNALIPDISGKADITYVDTELSKKSDTIYVNTELNKKADKETTYTKSEVDSLIDDINIDELKNVNIINPEQGQTLTYDELNNEWHNTTSSSTVGWGGITGNISDQTDLQLELDSKADKSDTYTKSEVDELIPDISGLATKTELALKADTTYVDSSLNNKQNKLTAGANITIENDVISAIGGEGESCWEEDTGEGSIVSKSNKLNGGQAIGDYSVAEGFGSDAKGNYSHAEGQMTTTNGNASHAEGAGTTAQGDCSHSEGYETIAQNQSEHAEGQYNKSNKTSTRFGDEGNTIHSIGIGTGAGSLEEQDRKNAIEVMQNGDMYVIGIGNYDGTNFNSSDTLQQTINLKSDKSDTYTKSEVDDLIPDISGKADIDYVDSELNKKADQETTYTKTEVDDLIPDISGLATKDELDTKQNKLTAGANIIIENDVISASGSLAEVNWGSITGTLSNQTDLQNALNAKANQETTYTKEEVDAGLDSKANQETTYTKTEVDNLIPDISGKADTTYVNTELAKKADIIYVDEGLDTKQNKLTAGANITIENDVISASGSLVETLWGAISGNIADQTDLQNALDSKANQETTYTKSEVDGLIPDISGKADTTYVDEQLLLKADKSDTYTKDEVDSLLDDKADQETTYTKTEVDELIPDISGKADTTYVDEQLLLKADQATTYTKSEVDDLIPDISGKADKSDTYTKSEVDGLIPDISGKADTTYVDGQLELKSDKSDTYTKDEVNALIPDISGKADTTYVDGQLLLKADQATTYTKTEVDNLIPDISGKADKSDTYTKDEVNSQLVLKADKETTYTKTETDGLLNNKSDTDHKHVISDVINLQDVLDNKANVDDLGSLAYSDDIDYITQVINKPTIPVVPTVVSAFTNDAGYLTQHQDISGKADTTYVNTELAKKANQETTYTKTEVNSLLDNKVTKIEGKGLSTNDFTNEDKTLVNSINGINTRLTTAETDIDNIEILIPSEATSDNQLADKAFVNSSISSSTSKYISKNGNPFNSLQELLDYTGDVENGDYAFVVGVDTYGNTIYTRYKYNGSTESWAKEYDINNSSFTAVQWSTINSGLSSADKTKYDGYQSIINNKADTTYVDEQLELKANVTYVDTELNNKADTTYVDEQLTLKADKSTTYTKDEVNALIPDISGKADKVDTYTKTETNTLLNTKANQETTYTKDEVDILIPDISGKADTTYVNTELAKKADKSTTYTKTETNDLLDTKADQATTYTKDEVDILIPDISGKADIEYVNTELAKKANQETTYTKDEVDNAVLEETNRALAKELELDSRVSVNENSIAGINETLNTKADKSDTYTKTEVDSLIPDISGKADKSDTYTKTETDTLLNAKANQATTYTKTETDGLIVTEKNRAIGIESGLNTRLTTAETDITNIKSGKADVTYVNNQLALKQNKLTAGTNITISTDNKISATNTTYTLTQDLTDGHKLTFTPSSGTATTITIPDNDTTYIAGTGLVLDGNTINHSNSIEEETTTGLYKVKYDEQGHITGTVAVEKSDITNLGIPGQDTTYSEMIGATESTDGTSGLVPAPESGKQDSFLRGDGTWVVPNDTTYSANNGITLSGTTFGLTPEIVDTGTYKSVTVDTYGRVIAGTNPTTLNEYGITDAYTKTEVDGLVSSTFHYKGSVNDYTELPTSGQKVGDVYNLINAGGGYAAGDNVAWAGSDWDKLSGTVDLSSYALKSEIPTTTSQLTNNSGFITNEVNDLVYYTTTENLNILLTEKSDIDHKHLISDVTNLQTVLDNKLGINDTAYNSTRVENEVITDIRTSDYRSYILSATDTGTKPVYDSYIYIGEEGMLYATEFVGHLLGTADRATRDGNNNIIASTYIPNDYAYESDTIEINTDDVSKLQLKLTGVNPDNYGQTESVEVDYGDTFTIPNIDVDEFGRITTATNIDVTLPQQFVLQPATDETLGGIKIGDNLTIDSDGIVSATDTIYYAGEGLNLNGSTFNLLTASDTQLGGVKVGTNLTIDTEGVLSAIDTTYSANNGITLSGTTFGLTSGVVSAGTAGTSSATSGYTLAVPYVTVDTYGRVTGYGTHTHTCQAVYA